MNKGQRRITHRNIPIPIVFRTSTEWNGHQSNIKGNVIISLLRFKDEIEFQRRYKLDITIAFSPLMPLSLPPLPSILTEKNLCKLDNTESFLGFPINKCIVWRS